jgi:hypothetical protein
MKGAAERVQEAARRAEATLHRAYLAACDEAGEALHPERDLGLPGWACDMLAEAYEARLRDEC